MHEGHETLEKVGLPRGDLGCPRLPRGEALHLVVTLQQQILHMKEYDGKTYSEIAESLGMQEPAVRMQLSRARKEIRECYLKQMER